MRFIGCQYAGRRQFELLQCRIGLFLRFTRKKSMAARPASVLRSCAPFLRFKTAAGIKFIARLADLVKQRRVVIAAIEQGGEVRILRFCAHQMSAATSRLHIFGDRFQRRATVVTFRQ